MDRMKDAIEHSFDLSDEDQKDFIYKIFASMPYPFYLIDAKTYEIKMANKASGFKPGISPPKCHQFTHHQETPCCDKEHPCPLALMHESKEPVVVEHIHYDGDGQPRYFELHCFPIFKDGEIVEMIEYSVDITAKKEMERDRTQFLEHMFHSEKLSSLGTMSTGIAHELNNPLTIMSAQLSVLMRKMGSCVDQSCNTKEELRSLQEQVKRMAFIVNKIKEFGKNRDDCSFELVGMNDLVNDSLLFFLEEFKREGINCVISSLPQEVYVNIARNKMVSVLQSLILNAKDSFYREPRHLTVALRLSEHGNEVVIEVTDTGKGIPREHQNRIFDPFFTTKGVGKGTGLGLSAVHGIVAKHSGTIEVESEEGKGTTVRITLPVSS